MRLQSCHLLFIVTVRHFTFCQTILVDLILMFFTSRTHITITLSGLGKFTKSSDVQIDSNLSGAIGSSQLLSVVDAFRI